MVGYPVFDIHSEHHYITKMRLIFGGIVFQQLLKISGKLMKLYIFSN
jgi:hypothetical protein